MKRTLNKDRDRVHVGDWITALDIMGQPHQGQVLLVYRNFVIADMQDSRQPSIFRRRHGRWALTKEPT